MSSIHADNYRQSVSELENQPNHVLPVEKIKKFVDDLYYIMVGMDLCQFKKTLQLTSQLAYKFKDYEQELSLADCMTIMLRDRRATPPSNTMENTRVYYYIEAMIFEFCQRSLKVVGAEENTINDLDSKIELNFNHFKGFQVNN